MRQLNEKFSPSMPDWMREILSNPNAKDRLERLLLSRGIDPTTAEFHYYPVPTSARDKIKEDHTKIVFYDLLTPQSTGFSHNLFVNGTFTDSREFYNPVTNETYTMDSASWTKIFQSCLNVCYIDASYYRDDSIEQKRDQRYASRGGDRNIDTFYNKQRGMSLSGKLPLDITNYDGTVGDKSFNSIKNYRLSANQQAGIKSASDQYRRGDLKPLEFDKSGYLKDPDLLKRLLNKHPELKAKKYQSQLDKKYDQIMQYKEDLSTFVLKSSFGLGQPVSTDLLYLTSYLKDVRNAYNSAYELIKSKIDGTSRLSDGGFEQELRRKFSQMDEKLGMIGKYLSANQGYEVDWDSDNMWIEDED